MEAQVSNLRGRALNYAVAKAFGRDVRWFNEVWRERGRQRDYTEDQIEKHLCWQPLYGKLCSLNGNLGPAEAVPDYCTPMGARRPNHGLYAGAEAEDWTQTRGSVPSKLGEKIDIPEELI